MSCAVVSARAQQSRDARTLVTRVTTSADATVVVALDYGGSATNSHRAEAVTLVVDDTPAQEVLVFPRAGTHAYTALVGPLSAGSHTFTVGSSRSWPSAVDGVTGVRLRVVGSNDPDAAALRYAPALWARADTIGTASDLPLLMYVESQPAPTGGTTYTYTVIFSNEDGGTPPLALMARWGRLTDIEWVYAVRVDRDLVLEQTFQSVNHDVKTFTGQYMGTHPLFTVATLNNVFADRGSSGALIRLVPRLVDLSQATRESVMDLEPWTYRVMLDEARDERRISSPGVPVDMNVIRDPASYVYLEAKLTLRQARVTAYVED